MLGGGMRRLIAEKIHFDGDNRYIASLTDRWMADKSKGHCDSRDGSRIAGGSIGLESLMLGYLVFPFGEFKCFFIHR
jgi:hypothetical protein